MPVVALVLVAGGVRDAGRRRCGRRRACRAIHDITTDTDRPPQFVGVVPLRADAPNPVEYGGPELAAQQRQGYPDTSAAVAAVAAEPGVRPRAGHGARQMGWEIVASDPQSGRIEATDTTFWFGFKDDVVIRVAPAPDGSRVDVRSLSRVGLSDVGTNAARIRKFLAALEDGDLSAARTERH